MKSVFISYDHCDHEYLNDIKSVNQNQNNALTFLDRSLKRPVLNEHGNINKKPPTDPKSKKVRKEIRKLLNQSSKLLVLIGKDTHSCEWVKWEINTFREIKRRPDIVLMRLDGSLDEQTSAGPPNNAKGMPVEDWNVKRLSEWLGK
jgi:hypothetical protein